jgi:ABC-type branched-subunit amino acid transport system substrate-binding protein
VTGLRSASPFRPAARLGFGRRRGRRATAVLGAAALAAVVAGCGSDSSGGGDAAAPSVDSSVADGLHQIFGPGGPEGGSDVTMPAGMLLAMTGQGSFFGEVMSSGAKLAAAQIKAADGFDYQINIADHKSGDVPAALSGVREMVSRNGIKVLQTSYGAPSEAIVPIIEQNKLLSFNGGGSSPGQVGKPFLYQTRMIFGDDPTPGMIAWLNQNYPDAKRLAIVGTQENGVLGRTEIAPRVWTQLTGGEVVASEQHDVGATDFRSVVARIKASNPDAVITYSFGDDVGYLVKQLREANVTVPVMGIEFTDQAAKVAGDAYDTYNFATDYYDVNNPNPWNQIFVKGYRDSFGKDPEYYGANYYEQVFWTWELVRRVIAKGGDPTDTEQLQQALVENPTFPSLYGGSADEVGQVKFDVDEHTISKPMAVFKVENGKPVQLQSIVKVDADADPRTALVP